MSRPVKITAESTGHSVGGKSCGILFDVTPALARALNVKHVECSGCHTKFAIKIKGDR